MKIDKIPDLYGFDEIGVVTFREQKLPVKPLVTKADERIIELQNEITRLNIELYSEMRTNKGLERRNAILTKENEELKAKLKAIYTELEALYKRWNE